MASESKLSSKSTSKPNSRQRQKGKEEKYKKNMSSDDDDNDFISEDEGEDNENEKEMDIKSYRHFLSDLFPSKYMKEKADNTLSSKLNKTKTPKVLKTPKQSQSQLIPLLLSANTAPLAPLAPKKSASTRPLLERLNYESKYQNMLKPNKTSRKLNLQDVEPVKEKNKDMELLSESDGESYETIDDDDDDDDAEDEEDDEEDDAEHEGLGQAVINSKNVKDKKGGQPAKFNIVFNVKSLGDFDDYDYDEDYDDDYDIDEDEDSDYEEDSEDNDDNDEEENISMKISEKDENSFTNEEAFKSFNSMIEGMTEIQRQNPIIKEMIADMKAKEVLYKIENEKKQKKQKGKNTRKFKSLLREKNVMNDVKFFKENMTQEQQQIVLKQMEEIKKFSDVEKPYRLQLLDSDIPVPFKACAYKKINTLKYMEPGASEYYKIKNWVDTFMQIPFGIYKHLPITIDDGIEKCHEFMENAKKTLDEAVFGLNDAKLQIMQMIGQLLVNPSAVGTAIAIKGPMGTGKTTLIKDGISKILGRDFAFIALGGATDSSFLEGHSYTYEGSLWGKIVDTIINCKCMNPVFYFDELDKVSDTPRGEEIIGILTHLTDTTQNSKFHDKYFAEIDFDLSRCLFIFSYNDESKVNAILRDRMYRIHTKGYDQPQKTTIANNYLLPKIREQVKFNSTDILIPEGTIHHLITNHTEKEDGVRNLKRCLEIIHTKLNLYRLMKPGTNLFETDMSIKVEFPLTVTTEIVDKLIKKNTETGSWTNMYS